MAVVMNEIKHNVTHKLIVPILKLSIQVRVPSTLLLLADTSLNSHCLAWLCLMDFLLHTCVGVVSILTFCQAAVCDSLCRDLKVR